MEFHYGAFNKNNFIPTGHNNNIMRSTPEALVILDVLFSSDAEGWWNRPGLFRLRSDRCCQPQVQTLTWPLLICEGQGQGGAAQRYLPLALCGRAQVRRCRPLGAERGGPRGVAGGGCYHQRHQWFGIGLSLIFLLSSGKVKLLHSDVPYKPY